MTDPSTHPVDPATRSVQLKTPRRGAHPWIFQRALVAPTPRPAAGTVTELRNPDGSFAGRGFYNSHARIGFRVLEDRAEMPVDRRWFAEKLDRAIGLRRDVLALDAITDAYRVVHSEGDGLGGLVVDRFGDRLVIEWFAAGMWKQRALLIELLQERFAGARCHASAERHVQKQESFDAGAPPAPEPVVVGEHGILYAVAAGGSHKTGFFADQRDNRARLGALCAERSVLDLCCNSGGFALNAALRGARRVVGVDRDPSVVAQARANLALNLGAPRRDDVRSDTALDIENARRTPVEFVEADLFAWLEGARARGETFDVVVLDPSRQTRDAARMEQALSSYYRMNLLAMAAVSPGGVFLTCSCSGLVGIDVFLEILRRAARAAGRTLQVFDVQGAAPDHPVLAEVPESRYLKAVFGRVW